MKTLVFLKNSPPNQPSCTRWALFKYGHMEPVSCACAGPDPGGGGGGLGVYNHPPMGFNRRQEQLISQLMQHNKMSLAFALSSRRRHIPLPHSLVPPHCGLITMDVIQLTPLSHPRSTISGSATAVSLLTIRAKKVFQSAAAIVTSPGLPYCGPVPTCIIYIGIYVQS